LEKLNHPNIVRIYKVLAIEKTTSYIVMELVEGCNLSYRLAFDRQLKEREAKYILFSVLSALEYLSRKLVGIAICPSNVLIGDDGCVKLIGLEDAKIPN